MTEPNPDGLSRQPAGPESEGKAEASWSHIILEVIIAFVCVLGFLRYQGDLSTVHAILIQIVLFLALGAVCLNFIWRFHERITQKNPYQTWKENRRRRR